MLRLMRFQSEAGSLCLASSRLRFLVQLLVVGAQQYANLLGEKRHGTGIRLGGSRELNGQPLLLSTRPVRGQCRLSSLSQLRRGAAGRAS